MRLRNKKTGEIIEVGDYGVGINHGIHMYNYRTITEFNEEWEDYKPKEPLIKDEKIRKAVRAWADATGTKSVNYWGHLESCQSDASINFQNGLGIKSGDNYTIVELCGEDGEYDRA